MNTFSIVIVTYGRTKELEELLFSISEQPNIELLTKIIIVDNHPNNMGEKVAANFSNIFNLEYIDNKVNSLTHGRSIGFKATDSDVVIFFDDDIVLEKDYFSNLISFYKDYPHASGMQGIFDVDRYSKLKNTFNRLFWLFNYTSNDYKVYPSIQASYGTMPNDVTSCEWFSGTNFSYRKEVLKEIPFDLKLLKYCEGEDIDYSFRVYKKFRNIFINPSCKIKHQAAITSREIGEEFALMQEVYGIYLLNKLFPNSKKSKCIYSVSRIGKLLLFFIEILMLRSGSFKNFLIYCKSLKKAYYNVDIDKFNKDIL